MQKLSLYEFQSAVFNKFWQYSPTAFFYLSHRTSHSSWRQVQTSVHAFFVSIPQHWPGFHQRYWQFYVETSPMKDSTVWIFYWHCSGKWSLGYSRVKTGECERVCKQNLHHCWLSFRPATGHSNRYLRLLTDSRPVNPRPAKRPGCVIKLMLSCVPLFCPAIIGTCRPVENRNVWRRPYGNTFIIENLI